MSDYVRTKGIVYPINEIAYNELDDLLSTSFKDQYAFWSDNGKGFTTDAFDSDEIRYYLIYQLFHSYGEENGDFGSKRQLTEKETEYWSEKFMPILSRVGIEINPEDLRYMDWCYYNACESYDFYVKDALDVDTIQMDNEQ